MVIASKPTLVIGVMGVTGSGKSSFVRTASGRADVVVGHTLEACEWIQQSSFLALLKIFRYTEDYCISIQHS